MAKNLDGIKKLNSAEAKQYRRIVLDYIGEPGTTAGENKNHYYRLKRPRESMALI